MAGSVSCGGRRRLQVDHQATSKAKASDGFFQASLLLFGRPCRCDHIDLALCVLQQLLHISLPHVEAKNLPDRPNLYADTKSSKTAQTLPSRPATGHPSAFRSCGLPQCVRSSGCSSGTRYDMKNVQSGKHLSATPHHNIMSHHELRDAL